MGDKHYVYSARTTKDGLDILNKAKGDRSWDSFVNEAVTEHYRLDPAVINLPPSKFLAERAERKATKEAEKAAKKAERDATKKASAKGKKADGKKANVKVDKAAKKTAAQPAAQRE